MIVFARLIVNLYEQRESADYDPVHTFDDEMGHRAISEARTAIQYFDDASAAQRGAFLALLLLKPGKREREAKMA